MKSPLTGKTMTLHREPRSIVFRKEAFEVNFHYWLCEDSGEQFTTESLDEINLGQAYNQYRSRHKLPFLDEIQKIREQYGLSASKMSEVLGFGVNVYRQYEAGEVPNESNAKLIQLAADPARFQSLLQLNASLDAKTLDKLIHRTEALIKTHAAAASAEGWEGYVVGNQLPDEYSGYRKPNLQKFGAMVAAFAAGMLPWKTKLNKLLFYADFVHFGKTCYSISGMRYDAIKMGPVPHNFQGLYQLLADRNTVRIEYVAYDNGSLGERFHPLGLAPAEVLDEAELATVQAVIERFRNRSNQEIIFESHLERAWKENVDRSTPTISYLKYGFEIGK